MFRILNQVGMLNGVQKNNIINQLQFNMFNGILKYLLKTFCINIIELLFKEKV